MSELDADYLAAQLYDTEEKLSDCRAERDLLRKDGEQLRTRVERLEKALRQISLKRCDHDTSPCRSQNLAKEALREGTTYGEGKAYPVRNGPDTANEGIGVPPKNGEGKA